MVLLEIRKSAEILGDVEKGQKVFFAACMGWPNFCNPGGEDQLRQMKRELELMGVNFTGSLVLDALCNKGWDEVGLLKKLRQVSQADLVLALTCKVGEQILEASGKKIVAAASTIKVEGFEGVWTEKEPCRLCGECFLDLSGGLCPLYFCPKALLNGPCQGADHGRCEVDRHKACGWELIYERLRKLNKLEILKTYAGPRDHSEILPLLRLRTSVALAVSKI